MGNYPHIKFELNQKLDEEMLAYFAKHKEPKAGFSFIDEIIKAHPSLVPILNMESSARKKALDIYIEEFYRKNRPALEDTATLLQKKWDEIEDSFFNLSAKIFSCPWPEGRYVGYISILPIGPRFLKDKTFQTCWTWRDNLTGQVIHELLHFQFYNLAHLTCFDKIVDENVLWEVSEIFNDIIQVQPEFVAIQGYSPRPSYPDHLKKIDRYNNVWNKTRTADKFLEEIAKTVKK